MTYIQEDEIANDKNNIDSLQIVKGLITKNIDSMHMAKFFYIFFLEICDPNLCKRTKNTRYLFLYIWSNFCNIKLFAIY